MRTVGNTPEMCRKEISPAAFCDISADVFSFPNQRAAGITVDAVGRRLDNNMDSIYISR